MTNPTTDLAARFEAKREECAGAPYGIVDPEYARVFTIARCIAWSEGYAMLMQGSFTRDLDLLAVPWAEQATDAEHLVRRIAVALDDLDILVKDPAAASQATVKPHGRRSWTLTFKAFGDPRFIDLGVMPTAGARDMARADATAPVTGTNDLASAIAAAVMGMGWALPEFTGHEDEEAEEQSRRYGMVQEVVSAVLSKSPTSPQPAGAERVSMYSVDAVAEAWASIDGKADEYRAGRNAASILDEPGGHFSGYQVEAQELIARIEKRGYKLVPASLPAALGSGEGTAGEPSGAGSREPGPTVPAYGFDPSRKPNWVDRAAWCAEQILPLIPDEWGECRDGAQSIVAGTSIPHLRWMARQLAERQLDSETKACRWLGWLQHGVVSCCLSTLEDEKERNIASATEARRAETLGSACEGAARRETPHPQTLTPSVSEVEAADPWATLRKIAELRYAEDACEPFDEALDLADAALATLTASQEQDGEVRS